MLVGELSLGTLKEIAKGIIIGLAVNGICFLLSFGLSYLGVNSLLNVLTMQFPFWVTLVIILMSIPIVAMYIESRHASHGFVAVVPRRPEPAIMFTMNHFGVKWKVLYGGFLGTEPYAFHDGGPYCPDCDYEMEAEKRGLLRRYYWKCDCCGKLYECPIKHPYDAGKIVERLLESEVRSGRLRLNS